MSDDQITPDHLRLIKPPSGPSDVLFLERRGSDRLPLNGTATAIITDNTDRKNPAKKICTVKLANQSATGLGIIAPEPIPTGHQVAVFIQPHGADNGYELTGTVVRCHKHDLGHEVGINTPSQILAA